MSGQNNFANSYAPTCDATSRVTTVSERPGLHVRPAVPGDGVALSGRLRRADAREVEARSNVPPRLALPRYIAVSRRCYTACDGEVQALFGVADDRLDPRAGLVWMVASDTLVRWHRRVLVGRSRAWLGALGHGYERLWNYADARNEMHLRFLRFLGCKLGGSAEIGSNAVELVRFEWTAETTEEVGWRSGTRTPSFRTPRNPSLRPHPKAPP